MCNNDKSLFSLIRVPKPLYFGGSFELEYVITANDKSLWNKAPTADGRFLSTEAKPAKDSKKRSRLVANTSHADIAFGRESSATFSHREHLFKNLHTASGAEGSPKCMFSSVP